MACQSVQIVTTAFQILAILSHIRPIIGIRPTRGRSSPSSELGKQLATTCTINILQETERRIGADQQAAHQSRPSNTTNELYMLHPPAHLARDSPGRAAAFCLHTSLNWPPLRC
jgi:hypothetical protein